MILIGIIGIEQSFAEDPNAIAVIVSTYEVPFTGHSDEYVDWRPELSNHYPELIPPPSQQLTYGIELENILCSDNFILIFKPTDSYPFCVTSETFDKLLTQGWKTSPFKVEQETSQLKLSKEILAKLFSKLDYNTILLIEEKFPIHKKLYLSSECPVCFDKIDHATLLKILNWLSSDRCDPKIVYEGCIVHLDGSKSFDPDGNKIDVYNWYRTKGLAHSFSAGGIFDTWNNNMTPAQRNQFESFEEYHGYMKSLSVCCYGKINFVKTDSSLTFFAPEVPFDISMSFKLEVFDSDVDKFSNPEHITLRIRDT